MAAFIYEGLVLFGVLMAAGMLYGVVTQQRHALHGRLGLQGFVFLALSLYFVWFWTQGRQTVAQKTWRLRVAAADGSAVTPLRAFARYVLSWLWFLPALLAVQLIGLQSSLAIGTAIAVGTLTYAAACCLLPGRQFLHDVLCGTCVVDTRFA